MKERMSIRIHYDNLKAKMTRQRDDKEKHLGQLSLSALNCIEILNGYKKLGEKILKTAELCRKLETEMMLREIRSHEESLGLLDHHQGGIRHVDAHLDHRRGDEDLCFAALEPRHGGVLVGAFHAAMHHADDRPEHLRQLFESFLLTAGLLLVSVTRIMSAIVTYMSFMKTKTLAWN